MREWQQTRFKSICMPDAVYYQSIWAVRDLHRMEERVNVDIPTSFRQMSRFWHILVSFSVFSPVFSRWKSSIRSRALSSDSSVL